MLLYHVAQAQNSIFKKTRKKSFRSLYYTVAKISWEYSNGFLTPLVTTTRSIWKMLGPLTTPSRLTPIHQISLAVLSRAACASMSTTTPTTTTTRDRGPLWPHGMGPMSVGLTTKLPIQQIKQKGTKIGVGNIHTILSLETRVTENETYISPWFVAKYFQSQLKCANYECTGTAYRPTLTWYRPLVV